MNDATCRCCSRELFASCCQPFLSGASHAQTPEQLMRSRYAAFCKGDIDYLIRTHHSSRHQADDRNRLAQSFQEVEWLGLRVLSSEINPKDAARGSVEFVAFYHERRFSTTTEFSDSHTAEIPAQRHEKSSFVKEDGRWFYVDGETLPAITIARNDPCWCGIGKKFKQCHGKR